jgi:hypothetical protein
MKGHRFRTNRHACAFKFLQQLRCAVDIAGLSIVHTPQLVLQLKCMAPNVDNLTMKL